MSRSALPRTLPALVGTFSLGLACRPAGPCEGDRQICLAAPASTRFGFSPDALAYEDLDENGVSDIIVASSAAGTLTVGWDGLLTRRATTWSLGQPISGVVAADLDGDDFLDMATVSPDTDEVVVLRGRSGLAFDLPRRIGGVSAPGVMIAAEVDGMSPAELVVTNPGDGSVTIIRDLVSDPPIIVGPGPSGLASGDLDGDGHSDLAVALAPTDVVQILLGDGRGAYTPATAHAVGAAPSAVALADIDGSGTLDIITADSFDDTITVLLGDGHGGVTGRKSWPTVTAPDRLVVDANDPESLTIGVLSTQTSMIQRISLPSGQSTTGTSNGWASALVVGEPGTLLYGSDATGQIGSLRSGEGLQLTPFWQGTGVDRAWPIDLEDDGIDELAVSRGAPPDSSLEIWRTGPDEVVALDWELQEGTLRRVLAGDMTGDAERDLVIWTSESIVVLVRASGSNTFLAAPSTGLQAPLIDVTLADPDGDGVYDVLGLATDSTTGSRLLQWNSDESGALAPISDSALDVEARALVIIEADADEETELVLVGTDGGLYYLEDPAAPSRLLIPAGGARAQAFGDLDQDGSLDVALCRDDGLLTVMKALGAARAAQVSPDACDDIGLTDINQDGKPDLLAQTRETKLDYAFSGGNRYIFSPWLRAGDGWTKSGNDSLIRQPASTFLFSNVDADTSLDLVSVGPAQTWAYRSVFGATLVEQKTDRLPPLSLRFGDIDGDLTLDILGFGTSFAVSRGEEAGFGPLLRVGRDDLPVELRGEVLDLVLLDLDDDRVDEPVASVWHRETAESSLLRLSIGSHAEIEAAEIWQNPGVPLLLRQGDLDDDGRPDILALHPGEDLHVVALRNSGAGQLLHMGTSDIPVPSPLDRAALWDLNDDGHLDIVGIGSGTTGVVTCRGQGDGGYESGIIWSPDLAVARFVVGSFSPGRMKELVILDGIGRLFLIQNQGTGKDLLLEDVKAVGAADLDADGSDELLVVRESFEDPRHATFFIGSLSSAHQFEIRASRAGLSPALNVAAQDVDGDDDLDVLLTDVGGVTVLRQEH